MLDWRLSCTRILVLTAMAALLCAAAAMPLAYGADNDHMGRSHRMGAMADRMHDGSPDLSGLMQTLREEKTEIGQLAAQAARFRQMGGRENMNIAAMLERWIREHKAAGPQLMSLIRARRGDPAGASILQPPVLGDRMTMLNATHRDHVKAVQVSQQRYAASADRAVRNFMHKRGNLARKHLRQMAPYHDMKHMTM